jgi:hypothetical protein
MRSLKVEKYGEALEVALHWFDKEAERDNRRKQERGVLGWEEWDAIQVAHTQKRGERSKTKAERTLEECRKAQRLFVTVTRAESASAVDADLVERFQHECPKRTTKFGKPYSKTTVRKTLSHMSASYNRCNTEASGKKCVRGVVAAEKLLRSNPFEQVQWIEADDDESEVRQFSPGELESLFTWKYLGACTLVGLFSKVSLWACGRLEEMTELRWSWIEAEGYVAIPDEAAKWGKGKTFKIPAALHAEIERSRRRRSVFPKNR